MTAKHSRLTKYLGFAIVVALLILLVGCGTTQKEYVSKPVIKLVEPPRHLLEKCAVTAPPARDSFVAMSEKQQVDVLTVYTVNLLGDIKNCNGQLQGISTFIADEKKSIEAANKDTK